MGGDASYKDVSGETYYWPGQRCKRVQCSEMRRPKKPNRFDTMKFWRVCLLIILCHRGVRVTSRNSFSAPKMRQSERKRFLPNQALFSHGRITFKFTDFQVFFSSDVFYEVALFQVAFVAKWRLYLREIQELKAQIFI